MLGKLALAAGVLALVWIVVMLWRRPPALRQVDLRWLGTGGPAIVQFTTRYCAPCKAAAPHLERAANAADVAFAQIDIGERPEVANRYGIRTVPTIAVADRTGRVLGVWTSLPANGEIRRAAGRARADSPS